MSADLAVIVEDPSVLERAADPGEFLMLACERAKAWLAEALDHGEIDKIAEFKSQAEAIRVYTVSKQLGKDAQRSASEIVRRAERGLGIAVRRGQQDGSVMAKGDGGWSSRDLDRNGSTTKTSPGDYVGHGGTRTETYVMTDGVSDADFDDVIDEARGEQNLTRKNVADKLRRRKERIPDSADRSFAVEALPKFQAAITAGRPEESAVNRIVQGAGLRIGNLRQPRTVMAVATLLRVYKQGGPDVLRRTLRIAYESFGDAGLDSAVISGIGLLCQRFNGQVDDDTAIAQLGSIRNGASGLMQQVAILGQQTGKQKTHCVAAAVVDSYNRGRRSKRLPNWWKATAE